MTRIIELWRYFRESTGVLGEMRDGLISSDEAGRQIDRLRREYNLKDRP